MLFVSKDVELLLKAICIVAGAAVAESDPIFSGRLASFIEIFLFTLLAELFSNHASLGCNDIRAVFDVEAAGRILAETMWAIGDI